MISVRDWFVELGCTEGWAVVSTIAVGLVIAALFAELLLAVGPVLVSKIAKPKKSWVAAIKKHRVFRSGAWVLIVLAADSLITPLLGPSPKTLDRTKTFLDGALVIAVAIALSKLIATVIDALELQEGKTQRLPLKALGQAAQLVLWTYATVILVSVLSHRDVATLLTGLTAVGAVLVYVFRDPILGWTASVQIAANDLARIGDWITVPTHDANGWVIDIALTTIKIRNWNKTISTIPSYALVSEGFRNWRGMYDSGGRRITRAVFIDANSVHFCDDALLARLRRSGLLKPEVEALDPPPTNLTCFRAWLESWLMEHPKVHHDMPTVVRELAPEGRGIPVEMYAFSKGTGWTDYEHLQADIYDRVLAALPEFDLRIFQEPTGDDMRALISGGV